MVSPYKPTRAQWGVFALGLFTAIFLSGMVTPAAAFSIGDFILNFIFGPGGFYCVGPNPVGKLFDSGGIPAGVDSTQMFTFFVAKFEDIMADIYSHMFCGMQDAIAYPLSAMLTLFVVVMGAGFLIGIIPFTGKELAIMFAKFALVLAFCTQADLAIGLLYNLLVTSAREGIEIVLSTIYLPGGGVASTAHVFGLLDDAFGLILDKTAISGTEGNVCKNGLFAFLALTLVAYPALFMFAFMVMVKLVVAFIRAVFGYLFGLLGITFLLTLLPIFASLALFKATRSLFDKYAGYLTSFAFQMIVVFAFLAMVLSMDIYGRFGSTFDLIMPMPDEDRVQMSGNATVLADLGEIVPLPMCTICKNDRFYWHATHGADRTNPMNWVTEKNRDTSLDIREYEDIGFRCIDTSGGPTSTPLAIPDGFSPGAGAMDITELTSFTEAVDNPDADPLGFMKFVGIQVLMLASLAYLIEGMLGFVPELARHLGGQIHAAQLGGGGGAANYGAQIDMVGGGLYQDVTSGFQRGYQQGSADGGTTIDALAKGFEEAGSSLLVGRRGSGAGGGGIIDRAAGYIGGLGGSRSGPGGMT